MRSPSLSGGVICPLHRLQGPLLSPSSPHLHWLPAPPGAPPSAACHQPGQSWGGSQQPQEREQSRDGGSLAQGSGHPWQPWGSCKVFLLPILPELFLMLFPVFIPLPVPRRHSSHLFPGTGNPSGRGTPWDREPLGTGTPWGLGASQGDIPTGHSNTPNTNVPGRLIGTHPAGAGHPGLRGA